VTVQRDGGARRRRGLLWAGILAVVGLALLIIGLTIANGAVAWLEVVLAIALLVASYAVQRLARRETVYRHDEQR
jgi:membrane protein implicated in regulation of membrane protease activity